MVASLGILILAKLANTSVPFLFSHAVNTLNQAHSLNLESPEAAVVTLVTSSLLGYGIARSGSLGLNELR